MNPGGAVESAEHVASGFIEALKKEPLSLALVLMNIVLLFFFWVILSAIATQRASEIALLYSDHKEVRELLAKCVVPQRSSLNFPAPMLTDPIPSTHPQQEK